MPSQKTNDKPKPEVIKQTYGQVSITFTIGIGIILFLLAAGVSTWFYLDTAHRDELIFISAVAAAAAALHSAYYMAASYQTQAEAISLTHNSQRCDNSFKLLSELNDVGAASVRVTLEALIVSDDGEKLADGDLYKKIMSDEEFRVKVIHLLGYLEDISIAIQAGYADEEILHKSLKIIALYNFEKLRGYVYEGRKRLGNDSLYKELESLVDAWKQNKSLKTGEEFKL